MSTAIENILTLIEKARFENKKKSGLLAYWVNVDDKFLLNHVNISFLKKDRDNVTNTLKNIESEPGFLFWVDSLEGEKFYTENYDKIIRDFNMEQIKPWLNYKYIIKKKTK